MEKTMKIDGMMCDRCSGRVRKALEAVEGVEEALVSHENGTATIKCADSVTDAALKEAVENQGFDVIG